MWAGRALSDEDKLERGETMAVLGRAFEVARPHRRAIYLALSFVVIGTLVTLSGPLLVRFGIDKGIDADDPAALNLAVAAYIVAVAIGYLAGRKQYLAINRAGEGFLRDMRVLVFGRLQRQSMAFYDREKAGVLVSRMTADIESMSELIQWGLLQFLSAALVLMLAFVLLFAMSWQLTLVALLVFLATDAEAGLGPSLEPLLADRLLARLAGAEGAVIDLLERELQLGQQALVATAQPELERLGVLGLGQVHLVGQVAGVEGHVLVEGLARPIEHPPSLLLQKLLELDQLFLGERLGSCDGGGCGHERPSL
jgi:ABC-type multidrug transport system fused ATPase/permease subunit